MSGTRTLQYPPDAFLTRFGEAPGHVLDKKVFARLIAETAGRVQDFTPDQLAEYTEMEFAYADIDKDGVLSMDEFEIYFWSKLKYLEIPSGSEDLSPDLYVYFIAYASRGAVKPVERMGLSAFLRMCRQCQLLSPPKVNEAIIDLVFFESWRKTTDISNQPPGVFPGGMRNELKLDFFQFMVALVGLAGKLDEHLRFVISKILESPPPPVAWAPGEVLPTFKIATDNLGGGGDEKKPARKRLNNESEMGGGGGQAAGNAKGGAGAGDPAHAKRLEWELQRLYEDLRQLERDLESEKFARMDEGRSSRLMIDTLKNQLAAERSRRGEVEGLMTQQIESLRKELAEALAKLEDAERAKREEMRKAKAMMAELQDKHDQEDERRREEIRALRSEVDQERGLRLAEVALYREELARARADLESERARFEAELHDRLETIVRLRAELESAQRFRVDVERERMADLAALRASFEVERKEWEGKLRDKEEMMKALREAKDREAARREEIEKKRHDDLTKLKSQLEQIKALKEAADQRAGAMEDRMQREIAAERAARDHEVKALRVKIDKLDAELESERRMRGGEESKFREQIYALQKELEREKLKRDSDDKAKVGEISRLKLAVEQERAARLQAESLSQDLRSQLRVSESERIRLKTESEGVLSEAQGKDRRIRDLEQQLAALIKEYQILVTNDMNLARIMGTLQSSLAEHGDKLEKRSTVQMKNLLTIVKGPADAQE